MTYNYSALKARLTRAERSANPISVIDACNAAARAFNAEGYPDDWHRWNVAREDALRACADRARAGDFQAQAALIANANTNPFA